ncbi:MAG: type II toxin-antitoxin system CcdA family antitoxin [Acidimicrobiaceae bacterium]|nr:type II toxin-antitoxin system CcdA family antitoxin [Acidimicrobiaceae bacterium]
MARVNVYLPDDLADRVRASSLNLSGLTQDAILRALDANSLDLWLDEVAELPPIMIDTAEIREAVAFAKEESKLPIRVDVLD